MKNYAHRMIAITSLVAIAAGTASVVNAQTVETKANVPFAFTAGTAMLPAGTYTVTTLQGHTDAFLIRNLLHGVIILSQPGESGRPDTTPSLVFDRLGDQYFLRQIRLADNTTFELPRTAGEDKVANRIASSGRPDVVVVQIAQ